MGALVSRKTLLGAVAIGAIALGIWACDSRSQNNSAASPQLPAKFSTLAADKKAFLNDPQILARFGLTPEKLQLAIADFDFPALDRYVSTLMATVESEKFHPGDDHDAETALNPAAIRYNAGTTLRPAILDEYQRDAGPFSLDRYLYQKAGIPTFAHAPVAIRKEDLVAGKVEVAFVGVPLDMSSGYRDAKHAPTFMRMAGGLTGIDPFTQVDPGLVLRMADYGSFSIDFMSVERTMDHVRLMVKDTASVGTVPFVVGGDHAVMYADVAGVVDQYGKGNVSVVLVDAHAETTAIGDHFISDGQSTRRLIQDGIISAKDVTMVAIRDPELTADDAQKLKRDGVRLHSMADIKQQGWAKALDNIAKDAKKGPSNVFISFDISALDPVYAAGTGRPVPDGMSLGDASELMRKLCSENKIVGFDMLDVAPVMDVSYRTAQNANKVMHSCLAGMAVRKLKH